MKATPATVVPGLEAASGQRMPRVLLLIESSRSSGRSLLRGVANYARHHGPWAFSWEPSGLEPIRPRLKSLEADAVILRDVTAFAHILELGVPTAVFGHSKKEVPGLTNVLTDDTVVGQMAARHLLDCGFWNFAYCGVFDKPWAVVRGEVFQQTIKAAGHRVEVYRQLRRRTARDWSEERPHLVEWMKSLPKPVGLFACNDDRSQNVVEVCKLLGLKIPDQVAILGADDDELVCELSDPPLSSVAINFERAGYECAEQLHRLMSGQPLKNNFIVSRPTHIVSRQSTDTLAVADERVARALRFIRKGGREAINVNQVARAAGLSRRVLEKRFRQALGRSVLKEIRRVRVDQIARMLAETNEPVTRIAADLGYDGVEHIARYFRKEKGMPPLTYRKRFGRK
jgi:LacI family transcriptional regulator